MKEQQRPDYSQEVQDILLRKPAWHIRWGIPLIVGAFVIVLLIARFIPYPERVTLHVTMAGDTARIVLSPALETTVSPGTEIELIRKSTDPPTRIAGKVHIDHILPASPGMGAVALARVPERLNPAHPVSSEITAMIPVRESNLLSEIFKPVARVISNPSKGSNR